LAKRTRNCLLDAISNIFTFRFTSPPSVFEFFTVNSLYKLPTYLLLLLLPQTPFGHI